MKRSTVFLCAAAVLTLIVAVLPTAASADSYVAQRSASFALKNFGGGIHACQGSVWIGRTTTNSIEGTTTVTCPNTGFYLESQVSVYRPGDTQIWYDSYRQCYDCHGLSAAFSEPGGPGWCVRGVGIEASAHPNGVGSFSGQGVVCI